MKDRQIALVGAGQMGQNHARTISMSDGFQLSYVIDAELARAETLATKHGASALGSISELPRVDAAIIATSTHSHFDLAMDLLRAGIPVLCEKPLTPSMDLTLDLIAESQNSGVALQCGFVERFNPAFLTARQLLQQPVLYAQSTRHSPPAVRIASGVAEDLLIHDIDLALSICPAPPMTVTGSVFKSRETGYSETSDCILKMEDNSMFNLSASRMSQRKIREWRISTSTELIEVDLLRQTVAIYENISQEVGSGGGASYRARTTIDYPFIQRAGEPLALQLQHFEKLLNDEEDLDVERESIRRSHEVLANFLSECEQH